jgi:hypothetical protein
VASENENLTQSIRPKSEILSTGLSDPDCSATPSPINVSPKKLWVLLSGVFSPL